MNFIWLLRVSRAIGRNEGRLVLEMCRERLNRHPKDLSALMFGTDYALESGSLEEARDYAERALLVKPESIGLRSTLIQILTQVGDHEAMLEQAKWIVAIDNTGSDPDDRTMEKVAKLFRPFTKKEYIQDACDYMGKNRLYEVKMVTWAREFLRSYESNSL